MPMCYAGRFLPAPEAAKTMWKNVSADMAECIFMQKRTAFMQVAQEALSQRVNVEIHHH